MRCPSAPLASHPHHLDITNCFANRKAPTKERVENILKANTTASKI